MQAQTYYIIAAVIMLGLIPLVPKMMNFRILVLRKLHLNWLANLHENHFRDCRKDYPGRDGCPAFASGRRRHPIAGVAHSLGLVEQPRFQAGYPTAPA